MEVAAAALLVLELAAAALLQGLVQMLLFQELVLEVAAAPLLVLELAAAALLPSLVQMLLVVLMLIPDLILVGGGMLRLPYAISACEGCQPHTELPLH